jgi:hypothetical protein
MNTDQMPLVFEKPKPARPGVAQLEGFLRGKGWISAAEIAAAMGSTDRAVRRLAAASDNIISAPGIEGYKLLAEATAEEYHHYRNARRTQAREMLGKVIRTDRIFYRRAPVSP